MILESLIYHYPLLHLTADGCARVIELNGTQEMKDQVFSRLIRQVYPTSTKPMFY